HANVKALCHLSSSLISPPARRDLQLGLRKGRRRYRLRQILFIPVARRQVVLGFLGEMLGELVPVVLNALRVFHTVIGGDGALDVAGSVSLDVGRAERA